MNPIRSWRAAAAVLVVLAMATATRADTKTWVGGSDYWAEAGNWSPAGLPGPLDDCLVDPGTGEADLRLQTSRTVLTIATDSSGDGQVRLSKWTSNDLFLTVTAGLTNQGDLQLDTFRLVANVANHGHLDLGGAEIIGDVANYGQIEDCGSIRGNLTNHPGAEIGVDGDGIEIEDGTLQNDGTINVWPAGMLWVEQQFTNNGVANVYGWCNTDAVLTNADGAVIQGLGGLHAEMDLANAGTIRAAGGDLVVHCWGGGTNTGSLENTPGTSLHLSAASFDHRGRITVHSQGAVTFTCDLVNPAGASISLLGGTLSAPAITHQAGAELTGFGGITGNLTNQAGIDFFGDTQIVGDLENALGASLGIRNGDLLITGPTTNSGTISAKNGNVYFEGGYSGGGEVSLSGVDPKALAGDMTLAAGGLLAIGDAGPARSYADLDCAGSVTVGPGANAVFYGALSGPGGYTNQGLIQFDGSLGPVGRSVGPIGGDSGTTVLAGGADVSAACLRQNTLSIGDGCRLTVRPEGAAAGTSAVEVLGIAGQSEPTGTLDLSDNNLVVRYAPIDPSPLAQIDGWLRSGQNIEAGYWDGPGICSSAAAGDPTGLTTLGVLDNADYGWPDLEGVPVALESVLVKYTYYGDADLDGSTTGDDYFLWLAGFDAAREALAHGGEPALEGWLYGDFDYSGDVTGDDYFLWLVAFDAARSGATPLSGGAAAAIPEPVSLSLLALGAALVGWRRRRTVAAP